MNKEIKIIVPKGYEIDKELSTFEKIVFKKIIPIPKSIIERVNSFEDILKISGKTLKEILPWQNPINKQQKSQNALAKIQLITEVFNEKQKEDWKNNTQYKYSPYFQRNAHGGPWSFYSSYLWFSGASLCFGCYFKTKELSDNAGKKFIDIYKDYLPE